MNVLAHLSLSGNDEGLLIGNFIADSVKGSMLQSYPPQVQKGILLHRAIDRFTDTHPVVEKSKIRLRPAYAKYSGVITDIYYDHFLARQWETYGRESLRSFSNTATALLLKNLAVFPERSRQFFGYMQRNDIPHAYEETGTIRKVLQGMSRRARFSSGMENATEDLLAHYLLFRDEFNDFFPQLKQFTSKWIEDNPVS